MSSTKPLAEPFFATLEAEHADPRCDPPASEGPSIA
jgi:hypothetical protein